VAILKLIKGHEGSKRLPNGNHKVYQCPAKKWTLGWGRNVEKTGITDKEADILLENDVIRVTEELATHLTVWEHMSKARREVLIDMCYNLGITRFLKFKKMIAALEIGDHAEVATQMMDSKWAKIDVPRRAKHLMELYVTDEEVK